MNHSALEKSTLKDGTQVSAALLDAVELILKELHGSEARQDLYILYDLRMMCDDCHYQAESLEGIRALGLVNQMGHLSPETAGIIRNAVMIDGAKIILSDPIRQEQDDAVIGSATEGEEAR